MINTNHNFLKRFLYVLLLVTAPLYSFDSKDIKILEPSDNTIFEKDNVAIIIRVATEIDTIKFISSGGEIFNVKIEVGRDTYCKTVPLEYGLNTIIIRFYSNEKKIYQTKLKTFYKFPAYRMYKYPPSNFKKNYFHTSKKEKDCRACHKMNSNEEQGMAFEDPKKSNCYTCHKSLFKGKKYAHAPSINWVCNICHKTAKSSLTKYPTPKPLDKVCFSCHKKFRNNFLKKKYKHEPVLEGKCDRCHDVHATSNKYFTRLKVQKLCVICHGDKLMHKMRNSSKCKASSSISCTECHNPHSSDKLFLYEPNRKKLQKRTDKLWLAE